MMLLRRVIEHVKAQNWTAVALDFVIVVVGVFMGIQLGNWNETLAERSLERSALERLVVEYNNNLEILADDREKALTALAATRKLLAMTAPAPDPNITDESVAQLLYDCLQNAKFIPALGVTNSLTASGEIRLIGDPEVQRLLTQWPVTVQHMTEWQEIERIHGEELILGLTYEYLAWPDIDSHLDGEPVEKSAFESDYQGLFSSKRFEGLLFNRRYNTKVSIRRMDEVRVETEALIERIELRLETL